MVQSTVSTSRCSRLHSQHVFQWRLHEALACTACWPQYRLHHGCSETTDRIRMSTALTTWSQKHCGSYAGQTYVGWPHVRQPFTGTPPADDLSLALCSSCLVLLNPLHVQDIPTVSQMLCPVNHFDTTPADWRCVTPRLSKRRALSTMSGAPFARHACEHNVMDKTLDAIPRGVQSAPAALLEVRQVERFCTCSKRLLAPWSSRDCQSASHIAFALYTTSCIALIVRPCRDPHLKRKPTLHSSSLQHAYRPAGS